MKALSKLLVVLAIAAAAALPLRSANAWWGWGPWDGWGDGFASFHIGFGGGLSGWGRPYYGYPYWGHPYALGYPYYWGHPYAVNPFFTYPRVTAQQTEVATATDK